MSKFTPLIFPPYLPTYDCDEIAHIMPMGDRLKFYFAGREPQARGSTFWIRRETKLAVIWPIAALGTAIRQAEAAAAAMHLLDPDDWIGEPQGRG